MKLIQWWLVHRFPIDAMITPQIEAAACLRFKIPEWKWKNAKQRFPKALYLKRVPRVRIPPSPPVFPRRMALVLVPYAVWVSQYCCDPLRKDSSQIVPNRIKFGGIFVDHVSRLLAALQPTPSPRMGALLHCSAFSAGYCRFKGGRPRIARPRKWWLRGFFKMLLWALEHYPRGERGL